MEQPGGSPSCRQLTCLLTPTGDTEDPERGRRGHYKSYCVNEQFESIIGSATNKADQSEAEKGGFNKNSSGTNNNANLSP